MGAIIVPLVTRAHCEERPYRASTITGTPGSVLFQRSDDLAQNVSEAGAGCVLVFLSISPVVDLDRNGEEQAAAVSRRDRDADLARNSRGRLAVFDVDHGPPLALAQRRPKYQIPAYPEQAPCGLPSQRCLRVASLSTK